MIGIIVFAVVAIIIKVWTGSWIPALLLGFVSLAFIPGTHSGGRDCRDCSNCPDYWDCAANPENPDGRP